MKALIGPWDGEGNRDISIELDVYDTWNVDYTLAVIAAPLLCQLDTRSQVDYICSHNICSKFSWYYNYVLKYIWD